MDCGNWKVCYGVAHWIKTFMDVTVQEVVSKKWNRTDGWHELLPHLFASRNYLRKSWSTSTIAKMLPSGTLLLGRHNWWWHICHCASSHPQVYIYLWLLRKSWRSLILKQIFETNNVLFSTFIFHLHASCNFITT